MQTEDDSNLVIWYALALHDLNMSPLEMALGYLLTMPASSCLVQNGLLLSLHQILTLVDQRFKACPILSRVTTLSRHVSEELPLLSNLQFSYLYNAFVSSDIALWSG